MVTCTDDKTHLAISIAAADHGLSNANTFCGAAGLPGTSVLGSGESRLGEIVGEEKQSKYSAMKKSSFAAQHTNSTVCAMSAESRGLHDHQCRTLLE